MIYSKYYNIQNLEYKIKNEKYNMICMILNSETGKIYHIKQLFIYKKHKICGKKL